MPVRKSSTIWGKGEEGWKSLSRVLNKDRDLDDCYVGRQTLKRRGNSKQEN